MSNPHYQAIVAAPGFALGICCSDDEVSAVEYLAPQAAQAPGNLLAAETARQIQAYLDDPAFEFGLPLRPAGTFFQRRVWAEIERIPLGQCLTYGQVAKNIRNAPRAVGQACGRNPYPLVVPCHRVVASGGGLGGFSQHGDGFMLDIKRWLLQHEGCDFAATPR
jgi:methylated-DNA-[protein]-cysteine S-methyltransferase